VVDVKKEVVELFLNQRIGITFLEDKLIFRKGIIKKIISDTIIFDDFESGERAIECENIKSIRRLGPNE